MNICKKKKKKTNTHIPRYCKALSDRPKESQWETQNPLNAGTDACAQKLKCTGTLPPPPQQYSLVATVAIFLCANNETLDLHQLIASSVWRGVAGMKINTTSKSVCQRRCAIPRKYITTTATTKWTQSNCTKLSKLQLHRSNNSRPQFALHCRRNFLALLLLLLRTVLLAKKSRAFTRSTVIWLTLQWQ